MKNLKIILKLFIYSFIIVFFFTSFIDEKITAQDCSAAWVKDQNLSIRLTKPKPISPAVESPFERCVISLSQAGYKSPEIVQAYTHLIDYYKVADPSKIQQLRNLDKGEIK